MTLPCHGRLFLTQGGNVRPGAGVLVEYEPPNDWSTFGTSPTVLMASLPPFRYSCWKNAVIGAWLCGPTFTVPYGPSSETCFSAAWSFFWPPERSPLTFFRPSTRPHALMKNPYVNVLAACGAAAPNGGIVLNHLPIIALYALAAGVFRSPAVPAPPAYAP